MGSESQSRVEQVSMRISPHQLRELDGRTGEWGEVILQGKTIRTLKVYDPDAALAALAELHRIRTAEASGGNFAAQPGANSIKQLAKKLADRVGVRQPALA